MNSVRVYDLAVSRRGGHGWKERELKILLNWPMIKCTGAINMGYCQSGIPKEILARFSIETRKLFLLMMTEHPQDLASLIRKTTQYNYNKYTRITVIISGLLGAIY